MPHIFFYRKVYFLAKYYVHVHIQGVQYMCYHAM